MNDYEALVRLQEIDLELMRINHTLKDMPQAKKLDAIARSRSKLQAETTTILGQRKDSQMELDQNEADHLRYLGMQDEVRRLAQAENDHRRMADYESQLTSLAKKIEKLDHLRGREEDRLAKLKRAEDNAQALMVRLDQEEQAVRKSMQEGSADLMRRVAELARDRKRMMGLLDPKTQEAYARAFKRFGGLAVERLQGGVPSVCRVSLQPSALADLRRQGAIATCPYCHRMLVTQEAAS